MLATVMAKLSNFVPEAGIWLNTQRPEWNDANNALVGNGVSIVTLYYLRRFLAFFQENLKEVTSTTYPLSVEMLPFFEGIKTTFASHAKLVGEPISNRDRKTVMDALGQVATNYREQIYTHGFSGEGGNYPRATPGFSLYSTAIFGRRHPKKQKRRRALSRL